MIGSQEAHKVEAENWLKCVKNKNAFLKTKSQAKISGSNRRVLE